MTGSPVAWAEIVWELTFFFLKAFHPILLFGAQNSALLKYIIWQLDVSRNMHGPFNCSSYLASEFWKYDCAVDAFECLTFEWRGRSAKFDQGCIHYTDFSVDKRFLNESKLHETGRCIYLNLSNRNLFSCKTFRFASVWTTDHTPDQTRHQWAKVPNPYPTTEMEESKSESSLQNQCLLNVFRSSPTRWMQKIGTATK